MPKVAAFHSTAPNDPKKYHDNSACTEGNNIESKNRKAGTGGYPRCDHCTRLERDGK